jgi:small conductance mechanosensitive channel
MMDRLFDYLPLVVTLIGTAVILAGAHWLLLGRQKEFGSEKKFARQLILLALTILGILAIAVALPIRESTRNQVIAFIGLVVSGVLAFSSTTIFANLMAGIMMRITRPFRAGDFIRVEGFFGRVAERGILDTEIQTESRDLIAIPNTFLINHPVSVIRSSGTIVSVTISLGYDLHHSRIESLLVQAAANAKLEEPFVYVTDLGNFAVSYKISGLLKETKQVLSARSNLYRSVLDSLHRDGIEIVSPAFMNQRPSPAEQRFIPPERTPKPAAKSTSAEEIVFDKAEEAERRELEKLELEQAIERATEALKDAGESERTRLDAAIEQARKRLAEIETQAAKTPVSE